MMDLKFLHYFHFKSLFLNHPNQSVIGRILIVNCSKNIIYGKRVGVGFKKSGWPSSGIISIPDSIPPFKST